MVFKSYIVGTCRYCLSPYREVSYERFYVMIITVCLFLVYYQEYERIPFQRQQGLEKACSKLQSLQKQLKRNRLPLALLHEVECALDLIAICLKHT